MHPKHHLSLELAKELYEAGIVRNAECWWYERYIHGRNFGEQYYIADKTNQEDDPICPAPILGELMEMLPEIRIIKRPDKDGNPSYLARWQRDIAVRQCIGTKPTDALGNLLPWLYEKGHLVS